VGRIVITAAGYLGDVAAYVPIANRLVERGHEVRFALPSDLHETFANERFAVVRGGTECSPSRLAADERHSKVVHKTAGLGAAQFGRYMVRTWQLDPIDDIVAAVTDACSDADVVLTHPAWAWCTRIAAALTGVPVVTGHLFPMFMIPSRQTPPPWWTGMRPHGRAGQLLVAAGWSVSRYLGGRPCYDGAINAVRRRYGLPPERCSALLAGLAADRVLLLTSRHYFDAPSDWRDRYPLTGLTAWDARHNAVESCVEAFLNDGQPPVLVTLGTSASCGGRAMFEQIASALDTLGVRGLFLVGHDDNRAMSVSGRHLVTTFAPIGQVLARCSAVVQSGSHGTNTAVLRAGRPSVTIPRMIDQRWHAQRVAELGCGIGLGATPSIGDLRRAISAVLDDGSYRRTAEEFAHRLADEDGAGNACDEIEALIR
jgi:UDP:flavonoid glycosyltransferase YjiC (YdhE family)